MSENVVYFTYDAKKNREHHGEHSEKGQEYAIPGVPLQDLLLTDYEQLPLHMQRSVDNAPFYTATNEGQKAIDKREREIKRAEAEERKAAEAEAAAPQKGTKRAEKNADATAQEVTDASGS